ncbi:2-hydroxyacid dehydrogenase [Fangia hongkongensis]|uniref:2-hydroxyacid dehydrogenase n=1 Tax=Fangia hongkongensis TaxID=270495 RepID=UPI00037655A6|nr:NAD(P)-dependent oxidoreductase [Fangia hongkongensis]MBK2125802.1 3-phosphoglycerate dehydrogenase [Fangia hongkongensis]
MKKVAIIEPIGQPFEVIKEKLFQFEVHEFDLKEASDDLLIETLQDFEVILLTYRVLSSKVIMALPKLQMISVAFAGVDHVDSKAVKSRGIHLTNATGYASIAVSELVMGLMVSLARRIPQNNTGIRAGMLSNTGSELHGKTLGIVGYGHIGKALEVLARAFSMNILPYNHGDEYAALEALFFQSDYISLHVPLNGQTKGMINQPLLSKMKSTAFLINCARGPIVDHDSLIWALENKVIAGAALDVFNQEPPINNEPLLGFDNVIATSHIGFNTKEALIRKANIAIDNVVSFYQKN